MEAEARAQVEFARVPEWAGPVVLAATFAGLAAWSWGRWTDAQIDFGTELYVPWRIGQGDVLYRDIASRNGPLSHHVNALWFTLFGVSVRTLVLCNLAILAALCAMTWRVFRRSCDALTATLTCGTLLVVFAFSQYVTIGNYNYVTPYQHAQTHGLTLSVAMVLSLVGAIRRPKAGWIALAGVCLGLVWLTKAEIALAATATAAAGVVLAGRAQPADLRTWAHRAGLFTAAALLPAAAAFALLRPHMPSDMALAGVLGNWAAWGSGVWADPFYARGAGIDDAAGNFLRGLQMSLAIAAIPALAWAAESWGFPRRGHRPWAAVAGVCVLVALGIAVGGASWLQVPRGLPFMSLAILLGGVVACVRRRDDPDALAQRAPLVLWAVLSVGLLAKIWLRARIHQYGFVLAMPATLLLVATLVHGLPAWLRRRGRGGDLSFAVGLACVAAFAAAFWTRADAHYARKDLTVAAGADSIVVESGDANPRGPVVARALAHLEASAPADSTLLVLPEGVILNYWLRLRNPSRHTLFLPPEIEAWGGQEAVLRDLQRSPPDTIALVQRNLAEFGTRPFGEEPASGAAILAWVEEYYEPSARIASPPLHERFEIAILERRDRAR